MQIFINFENNWLTDAIARLRTSWQHLFESKHERDKRSRIEKEARMCLHLAKVWESFRFHPQVETMRKAHELVTHLLNQVFCMHELSPWDSKYSASFDRSTTQDVRAAAMVMLAMCGWSVDKNFLDQDSGRASITSVSETIPGFLTRSELDNEWEAYYERPLYS